MSLAAWEAERQARAEQPRSPCAHDFLAAFGRLPVAEAEAPGRVNLLGEHTDYNDGFVLPVAIPQRTRVGLRPNGRSLCRVHALQLCETVEFGLHDPPQAQFARYVHGCLRLVQEAFDITIAPLDIHVGSDVPMGVGLSSSAALEVATLRALRALLGLDLDDLRIAQLAQQAEIQDVGVRCGIMDQLASSMAGTGQALWIDTRSLERRSVVLPAGSAVLVLDSGVSRTLAGSGYNQRRAECEQAARLLGVPALRDVTDPARCEALPEPLRRRARHVVTENARVQAALDCGDDAAAFGALMNASHASLRDDFEVSVPALDRLVGLLQRAPGVHGARLTGAGFGGACVALVREGAQAEVARRVLDAYAASGHAGRQLVPAQEAP